MTLSCGFKGGEVTPLFFIGAALGNAIGNLSGTPVDLMAGLGFIAVFAGAANTPLACTLMGIELFGSHYALHFAVSCFVAYFFSGYSEIYSAQILGVPKGKDPGLPPDATLREVQALSAHQANVFRLPLLNSEPPSLMQNDHHIISSEMGKIRIYLTPGDQTPAAGLWSRLNSRPLYRTIINAAKKDGIRNTAAFMTHYGFTGGGRVQAQGAEIANPNLTVCVEIIDRKEVLEAFCRRHAALIKGRTIVYKHVEHWALQASGLTEEDASPDEIVDAAKTPLPPVK